MNERYRLMCVCSDLLLEDSFWKIFNLYHQKVSFMRVYGADKILLIVSSKDCIDKRAFLEHIGAEEQTSKSWVYHTEG